MQDSEPEAPPRKQASSRRSAAAARRVQSRTDGDSPATTDRRGDLEPLEEALRRRDVLLAAVGLAIERLLTTSRWEDHLQEVLERLGAATEVSRAYVAENRSGDDGAPLIGWRCEWVRPDTPTRSDDPELRDLSLGSAGLGRWADLMKQGEVVAGPVRDLPSSEQVWLTAHEIRAVAAVPIMVGQTWWGYFGFEECRSEREWTAGEIETFTIVARTLGAAMLQQRGQAERAELLLREQTARNAAEVVERRFHDLVQGVDAIVWEMDLANPPFRFSFVSRRAEEWLGYPIERWLREPDFLPGIMHPEDRAGAVEFCLAAIAEGRDHDLAYRVVAADGRVVWLREIVRVVLDSADEPRQLHGLMIDITERKRAEEERDKLIGEEAARAEAELAQQRLTFLASASTVLSSSLDYATTLTQVARLAVPFLADGCTLDMLGDDGRVRRLDPVCADPSRERLLRQIQAHHPPDSSAAGEPAYLVAEVLRTGKPLLRTEVTDEMFVTNARDPEEREILRKLGFRSAMVVPLVARERTLGVITFHMAESGRTYDPIDLSLAEDLAHRCALAIENARLYRESQFAHQRLTTLFAQLGEMAMFMDASERIRMVNRAWCAFFGFSESESIGFALGDFRERVNVRTVDGSTSPHDDSSIRLAMMRRESVQREYLVATPLGDRIIETLSAPVFDEGGSVIGAMTIVRDVTKQRRAHELERELVSTVAHDLRNPLGIILGHAQHHLQELVDRAVARGKYGNQLQTSLRAIVRQVNRMTRLVELYLDMSRIESGQLEMQPEPSDLTSLIRNVVDRFAAMSSNRIITLEVPAEPAIALIETVRIDQVLSNLLENALEHTPEGGAIRVTVRSLVDGGAGEFEIAVEDTGVGIGPADLPRLFNRFWRSASPQRRSRRGTGLGLYICKGIVEAHGGCIWATSEGAGRGSRFAFTLPLAPEGDWDEGWTTS